MTGFVRIFNPELNRHSVTSETGAQHLPGWQVVDPDDVRPNPWDFEEPDPGGIDTTGLTPDMRPPTTASSAAAEPPAGDHEDTSSKPPARRAKTTGDKPADTPKE